VVWLTLIWLAAVLATLVEYWFVQSRREPVAEFRQRLVRPRPR
jgi:hypothetical protein